jgi:hypothetical protein
MVSSERAGVRVPPQSFFNSKTMKKIRELYDKLITTKTLKSKLEKELSLLLGVEISDLEINCSEKITDKKVTEIFNNGVIEVFKLQNTSVKEYSVRYFEKGLKTTMSESYFEDFYNILKSFDHE